MTGKISRDYLKERAVKLVEPALKDALLTGYGFIVVTRVKGSASYEIKHFSWDEVKEALISLGAIGPLGGFNR